MVKIKATTAKVPRTLKAPKAARTESADSMLDSESHSEDMEDNDDSASSDDGFEEAAVPAEPQKRKSNALANDVKKKKFKRTEEIKPPTLEEMKELRDTSNLFHSNIFRLQVKEMLQELKIKDKYTTYIDAWLESFKKFLNSLAEGELKETRKLDVPLNVPSLQKETAFNFVFVKPTKPPQLLGAAATGTLLGPTLEVDVAVEMPNNCFKREDYLNMVYDQKRARYLAYLANQMLAHAEYAADKLEYCYHGNNPLKPVLQLTPAAKLGKRLRLRIYITAPADCFKLSRFVPWNNNIRAHIFGDEWDKAQALPATPHYNANVLFDITAGQNLAQLSNAFAGRRNFQEGLLLLKVWLRQRQLDVGYSGFGAHILAAYIVYLHKQSLLHQSSSSYQVARTVWNQLANSDWTQGITLAGEQPLELSAVSACYDVCFMDFTGYCNFCANVPLAVYRRVCAESKLVVELLNDTKINSFPYIFMHKYPLYTRVDHIIKISKPESVEQLLTLHGKPHTKHDYCDYAYPQLLKLLTDLLQQGLDQRVHAILPIESPAVCWPVRSTAPVIGRSLQLGLVLNTEHANAVLTKGPQGVEKAAAEEFRRFWGDKAELRVFPDASIIESVVWGKSTDAPSKQRLVVRDMVLHLLELHFQLDATDVQYIASELDKVFALTPAFKIATLKTKLPLEQQTDAEALTPHLIHCYDELAHELHGLSDLPLEIVSISGISPVFRYCEPQPLLPQARCIDNKLYAAQVQQVIIQLGPSGKWPNELGALRALKTAFYIKIAELLKQKHHLHSQISYAGLLVLKRGYCFRLELAHSKELALLKHEVTERGITRYVDNAASRQLERQHYILPKVSGALHALHQTHSAFGPTVLIAKRWLATQLLDDGMWPELATELLVAQLFLQREAPYETASPQTGFIRFLQLLAHSNWRSELFLLNFNNSWTELQITELEQSYRVSRDTYPPLCLATAYDRQHAGLLWSSPDCPNVQVLSHVTLLARHALELVENSLLSSQLPFIKPSKLFKASNEGYDLVIQLKPDLVTNTLCFDFGSPFVPFDQPNFRLPLAGQRLVSEAVQRLRSAYSEFAVFFFNPYGGKEIAIVWKPEAIFAPKPFKVNELHGCTPCPSSGQVQVRRETLVADFKFLLKDFYLRFSTVDELKRQPTKRYFNSKLNTKSEPKKKHKIVATPGRQITKGKLLNPLK